MDTILQVNNLSVTFLTRDKEIQAVRDVSFELKQGETLGIVGESEAARA